MLNIYKIKKSDYVNGNGNRFVLWVQGCSLGCKDCWNKMTWSKEPKNLMTIDYIVEQIPSNSDGITITGGEPFQQRKNLLELVRKLKELKYHIQIFTGYRLEELENEEILKYVDILVTGRYGDEQVVYNFNEEKPTWEYEKNIEVDIDSEGNLLLTGYPTDKFINTLKENK